MGLRVRLTQIFSEVLREDLNVLEISEPFILAQVEVTAVTNSALRDDSSYFYLLVSP